MSLSKTAANEILNEKVNTAFNRATAIIDGFLNTYTGDPVRIAIDMLEIPFDKASRAHRRVISAIADSYMDGHWLVIHDHDNGVLIFE